MTTVGEDKKTAKKLHTPPVDGGYAWVVCAACFLIFFIAIGVNKSMGLFLVVLQDRFEPDPIITAITVSIGAAGIFCFVSLSNVAGMMFGYRQVACVGSLMMSLAMIGTAYAPSIYMVVVTLGLISGVGTSAIFGPPMVTLATYFNKRRAMATGIAMSGGSVGMMVIPQILRVTLDEYGYSGALLILTGIMLQTLPAALLLRPITFFTKERTKPASKAPPKPSLKVVCAKLWDKELLGDRLFLVFLGTMALSQCAYLSSLLFLPTIFRTVFNSVDLAFLVPTVLGASDLVGRLGFGALADVKRIPQNYILGVSLIVPGLIAIVAYLFVSVGLMMVAVVAIGVMAGAYLPLLSPMTINYFGLHKVAGGFGLCTFFMGILLIPLPIAMTELGKSAGLMNVFLMAAILLLLAGSIAMTLDVVKRIHNKSKLAKSTNQHPASPEVVIGDNDSSGSEIESTKNDVLSVEAISYTSSDRL